MKTLDFAALKINPADLLSRGRPVMPTPEDLAGTDFVAKMDRARTIAKNRVGRPPSGKIMVNLRLDPDVVARFKATGKGWQARINEALRKL